eukprot:gene44376-54269_t
MMGFEMKLSTLFILFIAGVQGFALQPKNLKCGRSWLNILNAKSSSAIYRSKTTVKLPNSSSRSKLGVGNTLLRQSSTEETFNEATQDDVQGLKYDWESQWYPLAVDECTDRSRPQSVQLLGKDLVLWHDGSAWR